MVIPRGTVRWSRAPASFSVPPGRFLPASCRLLLLENGDDDAKNGSVSCARWMETLFSPQKLFTAAVSCPSVRAPNPGHPFRWNSVPPTSENPQRPENPITHSTHQLFIQRLWLFSFQRRRGRKTKGRRHFLSSGSLCTGAPSHPAGREKALSPSWLLWQHHCSPPEPWSLSDSRLSPPQNEGE